MSQRGHRRQTNSHLLACALGAWEHPVMSNLKEWSGWGFRHHLRLNKQKGAGDFRPGEACHWTSTRKCARQPPLPAMEEGETFTNGRFLCRRKTCALLLVLFPESAVLISLCLQITHESRLEWHILVLLTLLHFPSRIKLILT